MKIILEFDEDSVPKDKLKISSLKEYLYLHLFKYLNKLKEER